MTEETAKALAEAMNRLASAIEKASPGLGGIQVYHHGLQQYVQPQYPTYPMVTTPNFYPSTTWGNSTRSGGNAS